LVKFSIEFLVDPGSVDIVRYSAYSSYWKYVGFRKLNHPLPTSYHSNPLFFFSLLFSSCPPPHTAHNPLITPCTPLFPSPLLPPFPYFSNTPSSFSSGRTAKVRFLTLDAALPFPTHNAPHLPYSLYPTSFTPTPPSLYHCFSYNPFHLLLISRLLPTYFPLPFSYFSLPSITPSTSYPISPFLSSIIFPTFI